MKLQDEFFRSGITDDDLLVIMGLLQGNLNNIYEHKVGTFTPNEPVKNRRVEALAPLAADLYTEKTGIRIAMANPYRSEQKIAVMSGFGLAPLRHAPTANKDGRVNFTFVRACPWAERIVNIECPPAFPAQAWAEDGATIHPRNCFGIPYASMVRCIWDMHVTGIHKCDLVIFIDNDLRVYNITYDELFADAIDAAAKAFLENHVNKKEPPSGALTTNFEQLMFAFPQESEDMVDATPDDVSLCVQFEKISTAIREMEWTLEEIKNKLCTRIGSARGIAGICTWNRVEGKVDYKQVLQSLVDNKSINEEELNAEIEKQRGKDTRVFKLLGN